MERAKPKDASTRSKTPLLRSQLLVAALRRVRALRGEAGVVELRRRFGLGPGVEDGKDVTLPLDVHRGVMSAAAELTDDPLFGVHIARSGGRDLYRLLSFSARVSPTPREAFRRIERYIRLSNDAVEIRFDEDAEGGSLRQRVEGEPLCVGRHDNEFFVTVIVEEARRATDGLAVPERVWVAHPAPTVRFHVELGLADVSFDAGENGVRYSTRALDTPMVTSDPSLLAYLDEQAEAALSALETSRGVVAQVKAAVHQTFDRVESRGPPELRDIARTLGMSERSLQRRLADEGSSFQEVLDDVRQALARSRVGEGLLPLARVAQLVGYAELRPFLRAFKRWTGLTPKQYRDRLGR
jgi:AraC-like DNA-binding protein